VRFTPADPSEALRFRLDPPELTVAPGTAAFVKVRASSGRSFMRGQPKTHPFTIAVEPEGDSAIAVDGAFLQEAQLPKWLLPALLVIAALALIWFFLLKPEIKTQARDAVKQPIAKANQKAAAAKQAADTASQKADTAAAAAGGQKQAGGGGAGGGGKKPPKVTKPTTTTASATASQGSPTFGRIATSCTATCGGAAKAGKKQTLALTDLTPRAIPGRSRSRSAARPRWSSASTTSAITTTTSSHRRRSDRISR
jgi:hypothetical protein